MRKLYTTAIAMAICFVLTNFASAQMQEYKAKEIAPYQAKTLNTNDQKKDNATNLQNKTIIKSADLKFFIRKWRSGVTGASYQTTDIATNTTTTTTSAGTEKKQPLIINNDGTYYWEAYGEKKAGKWETTGKKDYPIVLKSAVEGKDWLVGRADNTTDKIYIWDGKYYSYTAVPF